MIKNQLGRRNLSPDAFRLFVGMLYNSKKQADGGDRKSDCQNDKLIKPTHEKIAEQYGIGSRTVTCAAKAVSAIEGTPLQAEVAQGNVRLNEAAQLADAMRESGHDSKTYSAKPGTGSAIRPAAAIRDKGGLSRS